MRGDIYKTKGVNAYVVMIDSDAIIITSNETIPAVTFTTYRIGKVTQCMRQQLFYEQFEIVKDLSTIPAPIKPKK